ncbi:uncharacterized protein CMU_043110 [Cryptosporidium muris RN66]|uniref:GAF domain-containing protein n=1 Tax=Cryptosporidium muris (strain RN66) TaxID=441375 RepID=B6AAJ6_CRYMR|nr:uncharacterized protein CMU_043110 [Cryptosporidium muris RN66]EEA05237.1 hypothetical protein, conserved [Cryptosporidium muris RN66]|eukprot:XP_002139586.1 hypothetical protein [Cryptosporidium muris RN66]
MESKTAMCKLKSNKLISIINAYEVINSSLDLSITIQNITKSCEKLLNCRKCNIYIYDHKNDVFYFSYDTRNCIKSSTGMLHKILTTKISEQIETTQNIIHDGILNLRVMKSILYVPILENNNNYDGTLFGIIEAIDKQFIDCDVVLDNKINISSDLILFGEDDEIILQYISRISLSCIKNCEVYKEILSTKERADNLLTLIQSLRQDLGLQSNLFTLCIHAQEIIESEHCIALIGIPDRQQIISLVSDTGSDIVYNYDNNDIIYQIIESKHPLIIQLTNIENESSSISCYENIFVDLLTYHQSTTQCKIGIERVSKCQDEDILRLLQRINDNKPIYNALIFPIYAEKDNWSYLPVPSPRVSSMSSLSSALSSFEISHDIDDQLANSNNILVSNSVNGLLSSHISNTNIFLPPSPIKSDRNYRNTLGTSPRSASLSPCTQPTLNSNPQAIALIVLINRIGTFKEKIRFTENDIRLLEPFGRLVAPSIGAIFQTSLFSYLQTLCTSDKSNSLNKYLEKMPQDPPPTFIHCYNNWKNRPADIIFEE